MQKVEITAEMKARISVVKYRERYMTCGSCQAPCVGMVKVDGKRGTTVCARHVNVWVRRAAEKIAAESAP